ncbi:MAG: RnfH family protein [Nevskia sp.]|nr:RnfH family protein [Nevskia sp.]
MHGTALIEVEVAYAAGPSRQSVVRLTVPRGCTLREAIGHAGLLREFPEIDLDRCKMGVFGRLRKPDEPLEAGDRVEIYRPLLADPKQARRERSKKT